jgi:hypothetical protein
MIFRGLNFESNKELGQKGAVSGWTLAHKLSNGYRPALQGMLAGMDNLHPS